MGVREVRFAADGSRDPDRENGHYENIYIDSRNFLPYSIKIFFPARFVNALLFLRLYLSKIPT